MKSLIQALEAGRGLSEGEYRALIDGYTPELAAELAERAVAARRRVYGTDVFTRGLIEISNICRNDCLYCGIRRSNSLCQRYRLTEEEIVSCAEEGHALGFRTFVLQGGEDPYFTDERLCLIVAELKKRHPDCAVTLSMGERSRESYQRLYDAGADRYLLRHETADRGTTGGCIRRRCPLTTGCAASGTCGRSAIRWAAALWWARRGRPARSWRRI